MANAMLTQWEKHMTKLFIDAGTGTAGAAAWSRIGKSTVFDLALNAEPETLNSLEDQMPTDVIKNYKPTMAQELYTLAGDPAFDVLYGKFYDLPTGSDADIKVLIVFPKAGTTAGTFQAWQVTATLIINNYNPVDKKLTFNLNFSGDISRGTVALTSGVPAFTANASA
ncbi:MAG: hypothetical protein RR482_09540 [Clostridia bacterium]